MVCHPEERSDEGSYRSLQRWSVILSHKASALVRVHKASALVRVACVLVRVACVLVRVAYVPVREGSHRSWQKLKEYREKQWKKIKRKN